MAKQRPRSYLPFGPDDGAPCTPGDDSLVELRVPMTEDELRRVAAVAREQGIAAEDFVVREIRASFGKKPRVAIVAWELKVVRSLTERRRVR